jgi:hypothetical protein
MVKKVLIAVVGLVVLIVGGSVIVTEAGNHVDKTPLPPFSTSTAKFDPTTMGDRYLNAGIEKDAKEMEFRKGQPVIAGLCYGMTLQEAQHLLGPGHSSYTSSGSITPNNDRYQARFPVQHDSSHEVLVTFVRGGICTARLIGKNDDSLSASLPGGVKR